MSALNVFARNDGAWICADTAYYTDSGHIVTMIGKVAINERLRLAIGFTGRVEIGAMNDTAEWFTSMETQAQAIAGLPDFLHQLVAWDAEALANGAEAVAGPIPEGIRLTVAYWDADADQAKAAIISSKPDLGGCEPFTLRPCRTLFSPPLINDPWPGHSFDPTIDAAALCDMQRCHPDDRGIYRVGGEFECWRIHAGGIDRSVIRRWPDRLGKPIDIARKPKWRFKWRR